MGADEKNIAESVEEPPLINQRSGIKIRDIVRLVWERKFGRYVLVGLLNTAVGYGTFALLIFLKLAYPWAILAATVIGTLFNFMSISRIVFETSKNRLILKFLFVYGIVYVINVLMIKLFSAYGFTAYSGQLLCMPVIVGTSFSLNKYFVFNRTSENPGGGLPSSDSPGSTNIPD